MDENYYGITDTGRVRTNNEDTFITETILDDRYIIACVIDGVGGYQGGEVAARIARDTILKQLGTNTSSDIIAAMKSAVALANQAIYEEKKHNKDNEQMACVLTLAAIDIGENKFYYVHVGDTRLYLLRDNSLIKVTRDHSFVGFLEDNGRLTEDAAMNHPKRNEINKALGFDAGIRADEYLDAADSPFLPGDTILICSDGLTDLVSNAEMKAILSTDKNLRSKAEELIRAANEAGGKDNITVVLVCNNKAPIVQTATRPTVNLRRHDEPERPHLIKPGVKPFQTVMPGGEKPARRRSGAGWVLFILAILVLATLVWLVYQGWSNEKVAKKQQENVVVIRGRNEREQWLIDSINRPQSTEVFVLNNTDALPVTVTDSIFINKDSLHIMGNGLVLVSDSAYKGPAFVVSPANRYLLLDSLVFENFDIGVLIKNKGLHLRNVEFKNCRVPVQYNLTLPARPVINGRFADTIFYNTDSFP